MNAERYIVDRDGKRVAVVLDIEVYQAMLEELEELEDIRAFDEAIASGDEVIPFEEVVAEIEREGR
jgi:PHD/YefM family antitoxin component YafN of YafNO toxin-antitoxin module